MAAVELADDVVDAVEPFARPTRPFLTGLRSGSGAELPQALRVFGAIPAWDDLALLASAAIGGGAASTDHQGFVIRDDDTVLLYDSLDDEVVVSRPAFLRLMARLIDVLVDDAQATGAAVVGTDAWDEVRAARRAM
jgi:hypothetical protein